MKELSDEAFEEDIVYSSDTCVRKTILEPQGCVLALVPWEFPILETFSVVIPALLAGNSVLIKNSTDTPKIAQFMEEALESIAPGVAQKFLIESTDCNKLYENRLVNYVVFAGSYNSALDIHRELAHNDFIECNLDCGGMNIAYIGESLGNDDAVLDKALDEIMWAAFYNTGQSRHGVEQILVHENIASKVTNMISEKVFNTFVLENPMNESCNYGCIESPEQI